jgi:hypothetical protein
MCGDQASLAQHRRQRQRGVEGYFLRLDLRL